MAESTPPTSSSDFRVRCFVDFFNFQLGIRERLGEDFQVEWERLGPWFSAKAGALALDQTQQKRIRYDGMDVYVSHNPKSEKDAKLLNWATNVLDRHPGVHVVIKPRSPKRPPKCPACQETVERCPKCQAKMVGTVEKGIDTAIVTDMIKLAWEDAYDLGVLVSSDADFVPAVEFLAHKGRRIIQVGFPPKGMHLARACWASIDLAPTLSEVRRMSLPKRAPSRPAGDP